MSIAQRLVNLSDGLSAEGILSAAKGGTGTTTGAGSSTPTISAIGYGGNDTATNPAGGATITLTGTNFASGAKVLINTTPVSVVTVVSQTQITFTAPALSAGSYILYVVNLDGSTAIAVPGIQYSGTPAWTTAAGSLGTGYETAPVSTTVSATSDSAVTYSVVSGTLPSGVTINASGTISGTSPAVGGSTTYTFTVRATDLELQDTDREFSLTINPDVVTWSSANAFAVQQDAASTTTLSATSAAGQTVSYSVDTLPAGLTLTGATVSGTATTAGTTTTTATATAAVTGKTAQQTITWTVSIAADAYWKYTALLLNGESAAAPFLSDASTNNFSLTAVGDTKPNNFNPYTPGYYSNYFDGNGDYLTLPASSALNLTGDFTIEFWVNMTSLQPGNDDGWGGISFVTMTNGGNASTIAADLHISLTRTAQNATPSVWNFAGVFAGTSNLGTVSITSSAVTAVAGKWYHLAMCRTGSTVTAYINGVSVGTVTSSGAFGSSTRSLFIGATDYTYIRTLNGYISNLRILNGTAVYTANFTPPTGPLTAVTNTSLLTCQSNRFLDNSTNAFAVTKAGDTKVSSFVPFQPNSSYSTYGSTYFDGSGDYLSVAGSSALDFGTGDFTVEAWINRTAYTSGRQNPIIGRSDSGFTLGVLQNQVSNGTADQGKIGITVSDTVIVMGTTVTQANQWYHVAVSRSGTTLRVFVNGILEGSATYSTAVSLQSSQIGWNGYDYSWDTRYFNGYISDLRAIKGTALYTANFTVPTQPLTAVSGTSLLTCQTNQPHTNSQFLDNSTSALTITRTGNATQGSFSPYGANWSNYFDGSGDYLSVPSNAAFSLGTGDFTVEAWVYPTTAEQYYAAIFAGLAYGSSSDWGLYCGTNLFPMFQFTNSTSDRITSTIAMTQNSWNHVAVARQGGTARFFINGTLAGTLASSHNISSSIARGIGGASDGNSNTTFTGYISNLRVVKGTAIYTSTFTPLKEPLNAITGTQLLTCQSPNFIDNSLNQFVVTRGGDTSVQKFSPFGTVVQTPQTHSVYFDGSGDYLTIPDNNPILRLSNNSFTIEAWIYLTNTSTGTLVSQWQGGGGYAFLVYVTGNGNMAFYWNNTGSYTTTSSPFTTNQWMHVAIVKNGTASNNGAIYVNGVLKDALFTIPSINGSTAAVSIGYNLDGANSFTGSISNFRIVNGTAVYTTNFTPPTAPLTAITNTSLLTCQSATIVDNSANAFTITANGNTVPRRQNPFGYTTSNAQDYTTATFGSSAYFDGSDYLEFPLTNNTFKFGTGEFTIEFWVYPTSAPNNNWTPFFTIGGSGGGQEIRISQNINMGSGYGYLIPNSANNADIYPSFGSFNIFEWHHLALVRSGTTVSFYRNGNLVGTTTSATFNFTNTSVGRIAYPQPAYADGSYIGYMSDVRIANKALYTSSFVPPSAPLQAVSGTVLLLNMDKSAIQDKSGKVVLETVGDAKVSTSVRKYGSSSLYFDGTGDYLLAASNPNFAFGTGDYTIEAWVYPTTIRNGENLVYATDVTGGTTFGFNQTQLYIGARAVAYDLQVTYTMVANTWTHITVARQNGTARIFANGVLVGSGSVTRSCPQGPAGIGDYPTLTGNGVTGYIDDLRVTRGYARYTANFTPPQQALLTK